MALQDSLMLCLAIEKVGWGGVGVQIHSLEATVQPGFPSYPTENVPSSDLGSQVKAGRKPRLGSDPRGLDLALLF